MKKVLFLAFVAFLAVAPCAFAAPTATSNVQVTVASEAALISATDVTLTSTPGNFVDYTGGPNTITYMVRTANNGAITMQVKNDFSPVGGPSVATPPTSGDALTYTVSASTPAAGTATAATGSVTAKVGQDTNVYTFGTNTSSAKTGSTGGVSFMLSNDPLYKVGTYTAVVQWTISAT